MTRARDLGDFIADGGISQLDVTGNATITVADNSDALTIVSTDADANAGPVLNLYRNSASPADNDVLGRIIFKGEDDAGNAATFARIEATATDVSNGSEDGRIDFITAKDDSFSAALSVLGDKVGVGTTSPKRHLHINGGNESTKIQITNQTTGSSSDGDGFQIGIATDGTANIEQRENADMLLTTNNTERFRFGSAGQLGIGGATYGTSGQVLTSGGSSAAPSWVDAAGGGATYTATADGAVTAGDLVHLKSTGNINAIDNDYTAQALGTPVTLNTVTNHAQTGQSFWFSNTQAGVAWSDDSDKVYYVTGTLSGNNVTFGTKLQLGNAADSGYHGCAQAAAGEGSDAAYAMVVWADNGDNGNWSLVTYSGTTASLTAGNNSLGSSVANLRVIYCPDDNCWLAVRRGANEKGYAYKLTRSGSSVTVSNNVDVDGNLQEPFFALGYDPDIDRALMFGLDGYIVTGVVINMSGSDPSAGSTVEIANLSNLLGFTQQPEVVYAFYDTVNDHTIVFGAGGSSNPPFYLILKAATNGTFTLKKISHLQPEEPRASNTFCTSVKSACYNDNTRTVTFYHGQFNGDQSGLYYYRVHESYLSLDGLTLSTPILSDGFRQDSTGQNINNPQLIDAYNGLAAQPSSSKVLLYYRGTDNNPTSFAFQPTITQGHNYSGIASENISQGSSGKIQILGNVNENQSSLTIGSNYFVQLNGTVGTTDIGLPLVGKAVSATKIMIKNS